MTSVSCSEVAFEVVSYSVFVNYVRPVQRHGQRLAARGADQGVRDESQSLRRGGGGLGVDEDVVKAARDVEDDGENEDSKNSSTSFPVGPDGASLQWQQDDKASARQANSDSK